MAERKLRLEIIVDDAGGEAKLTALDTTVKKVASTTSAAGGVVQTFTTTLGAAAQASTGLGSAVAIVQAKLAQAQQAVRAAAAEVVQLQQAMNGASGASGAAFAAQLTISTTKLSQASGQVSALRAELAGLQPAAAAATAALAMTHAQVQNLGRGAMELGMAMSALITLPLVAAAGYSLHVATDFEANMTRVQTLAGASVAEVTAMKTSLLALGPALGVGPNELAKGLFVIESAGKAGAEGLGILEKAAKMTALGMGETNEISRALIGTMFAYSKENLSAAATADIFVKTVQLGNMKVDELTGSLARVSPIASAMGVSFKDVSAAIATFTHIGASADVAATGVRAILVTLQKDGKSVHEGLKALGTSMQEVRANIQEKGLTAALLDLSKHMKEMPDGMDKITKVFSNQKALTTFLSIAVSQAENYQQISDKIHDANGVLEEGFEATQHTVAFQWEQMKAEIEAVAIEFGTSLLPVAKEVLEFFKTDLLPVMQTLLSVWKDLPSPVQTTAIAFGGLLAVAGPTLIFAGELVRAFGNISMAIGGAAGISGAIGGTSIAAGLVGITEGISGMLLVGAGVLGLIGLFAGLGYAVGRVLDRMSGGAVSGWAAKFLSGAEDLQLAEQEAGAGADAKANAARHAAIRAQQQATLLASGALVLGDGIQGRHDTPTPEEEEKLTAAEKRHAKALEDLKFASIALTSTEIDRMHALEAQHFSEGEIAEIMSKHTIQIKIQHEAEKEAAKALEDTITRMVDFKALGESTATMLGKQLTPALKDWAKQMKLMPLNPFDVGAHPLGIGDGVSAGIGEMGPTTYGANGLPTNALPPMGWGGLPAGLPGKPGLLDSGRKDATSWTAGFRDVLSEDVPKTITSAILHGTSAQHTVEAVGSQMGEQLGKNVGAKLGTAFPTFFAGTLGKTLGSAIPVVGALIGPMVGALFNKLFGKSEESLKVNAPRQAFIDAAGGVGQLNEQVLKATGSLDLMKQLFAAKTEAAYKKAIDAIKTALDEFAGALAAASKQLDGVKSHMADVVEITPDLEAALQHAYDAKTPKDYALALTEVSKILDAQEVAAKKVDAAMSKYGLKVTDMGKAFQQKASDKDARGLIDDFQVLRATGMDVNVQMEHMGPSLSKFVDAARLAGTEVPEAMRPVLQTAIDAGTLYTDIKYDDAGKAIEGTGKQIKDLSELGLTFGTTMETQMGKVAGAIEHLATVLEHNLTGALNTATTAAGNLNGALDGRHRGDDDAPAAAHGGTVGDYGIQYLAGGGRLLAFRARGTDTVPAMLTPGEGIVSTAGMQRLGVGGLAALNGRGGPAPAGGGLTITIGDIHLGGGGQSEDEVGEAISAAVIRKIRTRGVRFSGAQAGR